MHGVTVYLAKTSEVLTPSQHRPARLLRTGEETTGCDHPSGVRTRRGVTGVTSE